MRTHDSVRGARGNPVHCRDVRVSMSGVRVPSECVRKYPGIGDGVLIRIVPDGLGVYG